MDEGATLLDVRSDGEWKAGHVENSKHIPVGEVKNRMDEIPKDKPVVVYCAAGVRAASAKNVLKKNGYEVYNAMMWNSVDNHLKNQ